MGEKAKKKRRRSSEDHNQSKPAPFSGNPQSGHQHDRDEAVETWALLARTYLKMDRAVTAWLARWELTPAQFDVLTQLDVSPGISQQELADRLLVTKGNVSQLLARLEARELIVRERDGRVFRLQLTDDGRQLHDQVALAYQSWLPEQFMVLKPSQLRRLQKALRLLDQRFGTDEATGAERG